MTTAPNTPVATTPADLIQVLTRIAEALEKQNELTEELANAINGVNHAIQDLGVNL